jgi:HSP20 family protein
MWPFKHSKKISDSSERDLIENLNPVAEAHEAYTKTMVGEDETENNAYASEDEGELAVDVFQKDGMIFVQTMIAGVKSEDIDVDIDRDIITIRGERPKRLTVSEDQYYFQECHWGTFSRSIVLPVEVDPVMAEADFSDGILTISIPRAEKRGTVTIRVRK